MLKKIKKKISNFIHSAVYGKYYAQKTQLEQLTITNQYLLMKRLLKPCEMPSINDVGFKVYSQFEEDGMLLYIFSIIGATNKRVVEICAGDGTECMAANLIINHGWEGLLFDGDFDNVKHGQRFYASNAYTFLHPPIFKQAWITKDNINVLIQENGFSGEIDLLSLDIDGNDYYIMEVVDCIKPRVIICEIHNVIPADLSLTIPYRDDFYFRDGQQDIEFRSASLLAMKKLLNKKGYKLIGAHKHGFNVMFILNELGNDYFPEVNVETLLDNAYTQSRQTVHWNRIKDMPWIDV